MVLMSAPMSQDMKVMPKAMERAVDANPGYETSRPLINLLKNDTQSPLIEISVIF
jgi:hypothetical protein